MKTETLKIDVDLEPFYEKMTALSEDLAGMLVTFAEQMVVAAEKILEVGENIREQQNSND